MANLSSGVSIINSIVQYVWMILMHSGWSTVGKSLFYYHRRFFSVSHAFRGDKWLFLKGKNVRKGPPKRKLGADIMKMLDDLKESENGGFKGYSEKHNWTHKSCLWELHNIDLMH
jgi:hypothetical protein